MSENLIARRRYTKTRKLDKAETSIKFIGRGIQSLQMSNIPQPRTQGYSTRPPGSMSRREPWEGVKNTPAWLPVYLSINWTANNVIYLCVNVLSAQKVHQGQEILREDC